MLLLLPFDGSSQLKMVDKKATKQTKNLYANLKTMAKTGTMFGHQEDMAYGIGWFMEEGRSDVKESVGVYPAIHGWEMGHIRDDKNISSLPWENMRKWIVEVYKRGGINTISWHYRNPVTNTHSWDTTSAVKHILPGGDQHESYLEALDILAEYLKSLKSGSTKIPIIWRPYHEHNGDWFWWGKGNCTEEEYIALWRFSVEYLRDKKKVHNLIYAFSPDRSRMSMSNLSQEYFYGYPGDEYVDIIGLDNYWDVGRLDNQEPIPSHITNFVKSLALVDSIAKAKNKVAALTETGLESLSDSIWFTRHLLEPMSQIQNLELSWILVWRNAHDIDNHFFAPYPGHASVEDFLKFRDEKNIYFESDLKNIYKKPTK